MLNNARETLVSLLFIAALLCFVSAASAVSDMVLGSGPSSVDLDFRLQIRTMLFLQVGNTKAAVDTMSLTKNTSFEIDLVAGVSAGGDPVPIRATAVIPNGHVVILTEEFLTALIDGANSTQYHEVSWTAGADLAGSGFGDSTYRFTSQQATSHPRTELSRTVTYTLSSP